MGGDGKVEALLRQWDGENVVVRYDQQTGAWLFIAIHSTLAGPAAGGTRMKVYPDWTDGLQDALRLAEAMTWKLAIPQIPNGGGKAVIALPEGFDPAERDGLLRRYGRLVAQLRGAFLTGPDVGTCAQDMDIIAATAGNYVATGDSSAHAGFFTALGVFTGIEVVCQRLFGSSGLKGRKVLVQGAGSVGGALIGRLLSAGAQVLFTEVDEHAVRRVASEWPTAGFIPPAEAYATHCDIFSPCSLGGVLNRDTIPQLACRAVVGGANNQLAGPEASSLLQQRNILYAPDYVVNIGGAMAVGGLEECGWTLAQTAENVSGHVRQALQRLLDLVAEEAISTPAAALRIAKQSLASLPARDA